MGERQVVLDAVTLVQKYAQERIDAMNAGLESAELAGLLVQKYGVGIADLVEKLYGTFGTNEVVAAIDRSVESIDPAWRETAKRRYSSFVELAFSPRTKQEI